MQKSLRKHRNAHRILRQFIIFYILALPLSIMTLFTYDAITTGGRWTINMLNHGEYAIEVFMNLVWFILVIVKGQRIFTLIIEDEEQHIRPEPEKPIPVFIIPEEKKIDTHDNNK
jgi:hypothetical protein